MNLTHEQRLLLDKGEFSILGELQDEHEHQLEYAIQYRYAHNFDSLLLKIGCRGGGRYTQSHLTDHIAFAKVQVKGLIIDRAYSSGFVLFQACHRRLSYPNAMYMFHAPDLKGVRIDQGEQKRTTERELEELFEGQLEFISKRTGQTIEAWREWALVERYFRASEALELGIIDEILEPERPYFEKKIESEP